ncbi:MAG: Coproporphyrin ferrochelatase [Ktedonobacterales bacterium]|jgi:ferrochelatase|nr:MAG: Coproporphyrin ferrochelatase [Ktedonobacterales bacterium]
MPEEQHIGVMLMTYGSPATLDDMPEYLRNVRGGHPADDDLITEFRRRYELIGGSPLLSITREQAAALAAELTARHPNGPRFKVGVGMRFAPPYIRDALPEIAEGSQQIVGIIMSPQYSPILMRGYVETLRDAVADRYGDALPVAISEDWHMQPAFLDAVAERVREALAMFPADERASIPVLLTAHSMPKRVIANEPNYINHLKETAAAVAERADVTPDQWQFCYQSAGHTPEEWLKPDFADLMPELHAAGKRAVLIAPVQFLADHLEILYDIEIGAREQAERYGIQFARTQSLNTAPRFIQALADVVEATLHRR